MGLFKFNYENKTNLIFITAIAWVINFRLSFKNIDYHMDSGCYCSIKFDPLIILIKNIICLFFVIVYIYEKKIGKIEYKLEKVESIRLSDKDNKSSTEGKLAYTKTSESFAGLSFNEAVNHSLTSDTKHNKIRRILKISLYILIIYLTEEFYFLFANNHILDRIIVNMRNFGILIFLLFLSPIVIRKSSYTYRHQLLPCLIILIIGLFMILYNVFGIERFKKVFGYNLFAYFSCFILTGLELSIIKYLLSIEFMSMYLILFIKGVIGTFIFIIINLSTTRREFFDFLDKILSFEYDDMIDDYLVIQKIGYIISVILVQYLKFFTINTFTQNHILSSMMISDLIYFPLYAIERFAIQDFTISNFWSFVLNFTIGLLNVLLMLVFNEILECKFLGLDYNLKSNINKRQSIDYTKGKQDFALQRKFEIDCEEEEDNDNNDRESINSNSSYKI